MRLKRNVNTTARKMCDAAVSLCVVCMCVRVHRLLPPGHPGSGPGSGVWTVRRSAWPRSAEEEEGSPWSDRETVQPEDTTHTQTQTHFSALSATSITSGR